VNRRILEAEDGFTLAEVLTAMAVLVVGLVAVALAFHYALTGIETGRGETTAAFLAERALEELKAVALVDWGSAALAPATRIEYCLPAGDACTPAATPGSYRRATTISDAQNGPCAARCKIVRVTVFYRPVAGTGQLDQERQVEVVTVFAPRS
jgi:prepilin-type N-terminal cleavage/methylation domain-containing protein